MNKNRLLSGIQPTGKLHLGNYLGAVANWLMLQHEYECYFAIADMHSLTEDYDAREKPGQILELATELLALGLNPEKVVLFAQSQLPEHAELAWYFSTITSVSALTRITQYKDKAARQKTNINAGLLTYPVLQAADILLYKPAVVPVGEDQLQHLELTNDIVKKFNRKFGETFGTVKPILTKTPRVMSILDPAKKMSKSLGDAHCLYLSDEPETIVKKLARAPTDTGKEKKMSAGSANLFRLLEIFGDPEQYDFYREERERGRIKYSHLKANLAKLIAHQFSDYREAKRELEKKPNFVKEALLAGGARAKTIAAATLQEVKEKMGLVL